MRTIIALCVLIAFTSQASAQLRFSPEREAELRREGFVRAPDYETSGRMVRVKNRVQLPGGT